MNYGLPYMGSKNFIAEWVLSKIPPRTNFYDLFCGGGAITHAALLAKKHRRFFMNDLNPFSELFFDAVSGKYHNETRWVSRETFEREKTKDPYIAFVWSFGNNGDSYLYSKEVEHWKRALHYSRVFGDDSLLKEIGVPCSSSTWIKKNHDFCKEKYIQSLERLQRLESLERLQRLQRLERLQSLQSLEFTNLSYKDVKILPDSVIYCDIPYRGTATYTINNGGFDYEEFYNWAQNQKELVIISEYQMPEGFTCIGRKTKRSILSATANNEVKECLFIPTKQLNLYNYLNNSLFNFD